MERTQILHELDQRTGRAVAHYWGTRAAQRGKQEQTVKADQGFRSAVTGEEKIGLGDAVGDHCFNPITELTELRPRPIPLFFRNLLG